MALFPLHSAISACTTTNPTCKTFQTTIPRKEKNLDLVSNLRRVGLVYYQQLRPLASKAPQAGRCWRDYKNIWLKAWISSGWFSKSLVTRAVAALVSIMPEVNCQFPLVSIEVVRRLKVPSRHRATHFRSAWSIRMSKNRRYVAVSYPSSVLTCLTYAATLASHAGVTRVLTLVSIMMKHGTR